MQMLRDQVAELKQLWANKRTVSAATVWSRVGVCVVAVPTVLLFTSSLHVFTSTFVCFAVWPFVHACVCVLHVCGPGSLRSRG